MGTSTSKTETKRSRVSDDVASTNLAYFSDGAPERINKAQAPSNAVGAHALERTSRAGEGAHMNGQSVAKRLEDTTFCDVDGHRARAMERIASAIVSLQTAVAEDEEADAVDWQTKGAEIARELGLARSALEHMSSELLEQSARGQRGGSRRR
jgi:hypothetical protein